MTKIYIIAGEASGDLYGAKLMRELRAKSASPIEFYGIGGTKMAEQGFKSLFEMSEISIMGFLEILPHLGNILERIDQTVADIFEKQPDMVITIDSPGFCCRIAKRLRFGEDFLEKILKKILIKKKEEPQTEEEKPQFQPYNGKMLHYVAPTVWAYKPERAKKFAKLFDHLIAILPFEPQYFEAEGLPCTYIGHPIVETQFPPNGDAFRAKYNIASDDTLLCVMPGSRMGEVTKLLPIFLDSVELLVSAKNTKVAIPAVPSLRDEIQKMVDRSSVKAIILDSEEDKLACYKAANAAIVKSGTGTLEVALASCPMVIGYKVNYITYRIVKSMVKVKYANLINIMQDEEIIPEFIQQYCTPYLISQKLDKLIADYMERDLQTVRSLEVMKVLGMGNQKTPSQNAADVVLGLLNHEHKN